MFATQGMEMTLSQGMEMTLSHNIKWLRKLKGLTQDQLAGALKVSRNKIVSYESKSIEPRLSLMLDLSNFFQVPLHALISIKINEENIEALRRDFRRPRPVNLQGQIDTTYTISEPDLVKFKQQTTRFKQILDGLQMLNEMKSEEEEHISFKSWQDLVFLFHQIHKLNQEHIARLESPFD